MKKNILIFDKDDGTLLSIVCVNKKYFEQAKNTILCLRQEWSNGGIFFNDYLTGFILSELPVRLPADAGVEIIINPITIEEMEVRV